MPARPSWIRFASTAAGSNRTSFSPPSSLPFACWRRIIFESTPTSHTCLFCRSLDALRAPFPFQLITEATLIGSALALLFNRRVRLACLLLGGVIILGGVASKAYYGNNKLFAGLFIFLAGLTRKGEEPWVLRWQLVIVYAAAAINKWFDPDWLQANSSVIGPERSSNSLYSSRSPRLSGPDGPASCCAGPRCSSSRPSALDSLSGASGLP